MMAGPYNRFPGYDASYQIDPAALALVQIDNPTTLPAPVQVHASGAYTLTLDATQLVWCEAATTLTLPTPTASWTYRIVVQVVAGGNAVTLPTVPWRGGVVPKLADADPWLIQRLQFDWDGTAWTGSWTALDVDYPIDAIAGPPAGMLVGAGSMAALAGFTATGPRSLYAVYDEIADSASYQYVARLVGGSPSSGLAIQATPTVGGKWNAVLFTDTTNKGAQVIDRQPGRAAVCVAAPGPTSTWLSQRLGFQTQGISAAASGVFSTSAGLILANLPGVATGLIAAAYPAVHTDYQRQAIMRKLLSMSGA